jgi:hypothetical protein
LAANGVTALARFSGIGVARGYSGDIPIHWTPIIMQTVPTIDPVADPDTAPREEPGEAPVMPPDVQPEADPLTPDLPPDGEAALRR